MAIYKVKSPTGEIIQVNGPDGADEATVIAKAKELWAAAQGGAAPGTVAAQPRKAGGPRRDIAPPSGGLIQFNEDEEAAIVEASGGDPKKDHFLRLIPTIEWRGNADGMRSKKLSQKGAAGAYQFMPPTAAAFGVKNRFDFRDSVAGAAKYYDEINQRYNGNMDAMLADYNGGPAQAKALLETGQPMAPETQEYIQLGKQYSNSGRVADTSRAEMTTVTSAERAADEARNTPMTKQEQVANMSYGELMAERGKALAGVGDVAATIGSGLVGMTVGGLAGLGKLAFSGGDVDGASDTVKAVSDFFTWQPKTEYGKALFEAVAPGMEKVDETIKDTSMYIARGNPAAATAIETGANAALILLGPASVKAGVQAGVKSGARAGAKAAWEKSTLGTVHANEVARKTQQAHINRIAKELEANAKALGIELRRDRIHDSIRQVAEGESAPTRGAGFREVSRELNAERLAEKRRVQNAWDSFRSQQHFTDVTWANGTARQVAQELAGDGFNIESAAVRSSLEDIMGLNTRITTQLARNGLTYRRAPKNIPIKRQELKELQAVRERLIKRQKDLFGTSDGEAVGRIGKRLDEMLDAQFRADAAKGIDAPWEAWRSAKDMYGAYKDNWNEHKAVRDIIADPDMTPQKLANTIIGTSSMLGGKEASRIYDHIMMLTKDSPRVKIAVQGSVMYDLMKPLLDNPNPSQGHYRAVANNIRKFRKENSELITSMGIPEKDLITLQHAARAAEHTTVGKPIGLIDTAIGGINRYLVGHEIAQAGFRVKVAEKIINKILKRDATSHRQMLKEFAGINSKPLTSSASRQALTEAMIRGELANQYQNMRDWNE